MTRKTHHCSRCGTGANKQVCEAKRHIAQCEICTYWFDTIHGCDAHPYAYDYNLNDRPNQNVKSKKAKSAVQAEPDEDADLNDEEIAELKAAKKSLTAISKETNPRRLEKRAYAWTQEHPSVAHYLTPGTQDKKSKEDIVRIRNGRDRIKWMDRSSTPKTKERDESPPGLRAKVAYWGKKLDSI